MSQSFIRQNYRLYPNPEQTVFLNQEIGNQRFVWNYFLHENKERYKDYQKFVFYNEMASSVLHLKQENEWLKIGNAQALQQTLKDLDLALHQSFKKNTHRKGFPKFKKKSTGGSFRIPQRCALDQNSLKLPKLSPIKIKDNGLGLPVEFKSVTIIKTPTGKFTASFVIPIELPKKGEIDASSKSIGIDLNSDFFVVTSDGEFVKNPKHLKQKERSLKKYQRRCSRKVLGSSNRNKARYQVAKLHEKIKNQRKDFVEKLTTQLVKTNDIICLENLNVNAIQKWNGKIIESAPFGMFRTKITWKANKFGKHIVIIGRYDPSSKMCSICGQLHHIPLNIRIMECDCGNKTHRDLNAATNILAFG